MHVTSSNEDGASRQHHASLFPMSPMSTPTLPCFTLSSFLSHLSLPSYCHIIESRERSVSILTNFEGWSFRAESFSVKFLGCVEE